MYRVLIVEDDPMVASIDRSYVERTADFTVVAVCKNGVEALELFKTEEIDLVVLDYYTPGMNGDEFLDKLHETGMRPEVIMVTSANSVEIVQELLSRGISDLSMTVSARAWSVSAEEEKCCRMRVPVCVRRR